MSLDVFKTHAIPMATVMNNDIGATGELFFIFLRDTTKPGLWTMDWTVDWTMDWVFLYAMSSTWFAARLKRAL